MLITKVLGNVKETPAIELEQVEWERVFLHWEELEKRILRVRSDRGREIGIRLETEKRLEEGDILFKEGNFWGTISLLPSKVIVIEPRDQMEMIRLAYEVGNRHLPLEIRMPFLIILHDEPSVELLRRLNIPFTIEEQPFRPIPQKAHSHRKENRQTQERHLPPFPR
ncbi:urease accessory protein UreE [Thermicanus aegyptius]|uniref:urease accessory protein UreE n=1 Tax=Thermicanus aegyptius TaxID=94009 RepID=UPI0004007C8D|nr:urease accessory protein UreE [Thermicanus aegyptius]